MAVKNARTVTEISKATVTGTATTVNSKDVAALMDAYDTLKVVAQIMAEALPESRRQIIQSQMERLIAALDKVGPNITKAKDALDTESFSKVLRMVHDDVFVE